MVDAEEVLARVEKVKVGGIAIARLDLDATADLMIRLAQGPRRGQGPLNLTSANGEVIARCRSNGTFAKLIHSADLVSADGQPLVFASKLFGRAALPERVATTDLYDRVAARAERTGASFYLLGASEEVNRRTYEITRQKYPHLRIAGSSHGYLAGAALEAKIDEINALRPDILWLAMGVPTEQLFVERWSPRLRNVGLIKTAGGLFDFYSGAKPRAPKSVQALGLEWAYRILLEPRRLFWRYAVTNPVAIVQLVRATA
ncbi:MAG: N-acetylglucosaminyldiphosphoundecaprenol N-acetyl-beta-D-mannosaminyltransferase [Caballeronia sp.]|nr:N-acetylglucosaminyldiphosphoundecaprenol N-acetyl-beta-D-mannosaminyltransferase [Caballeronia sp.]